MLADAVSRAEGAAVPLSSVLAEAAGERGEQVGRAHAREHRRDPLTTVKAILEANGYEPRRIGSALALLNCPFHHLAEEHRALVCGMNRDFLTGVVKGPTGGCVERTPGTPGRVLLCPRRAELTQPSHPGLHSGREPGQT